MKSGSLSESTSSDIVILFSSGVESAALLSHFLELQYEVYPVYVRGDFAHESKEMQRADLLWRWFQTRHRRLHSLQYLYFPWGSESLKNDAKKQEEIIIPLRNYFLLGTAALFMSMNSITKIALGSLGHSVFPDNNPDYFKKLASVISVGISRPFHVLTPFLGVEKKEIIRNFYKKLPFNITYSCIDASPSKTNHCGICVKCKERREAFKLAEVEDQTLYEN